MRRLLTFLASALLATACAKGATTASVAQLRSAEYQPLAVGNQWTYAGKMMGTAVERTITIKGMKDGYFADDAEGLLRVDAEGLRDPSRYLLREPIARGTTWTSIVSVSSTERYEIVDTGFAVNTPAGAFNDCVLVRATNRIDADKSLRTEWTYAPGVGMVRLATTLLANGRELPQVQLELVRYAFPGAR